MFMPAKIYKKKAVFFLVPHTPISVKIELLIVNSLSIAFIHIFLLISGFLTQKTPSKALKSVCR